MANWKQQTQFFDFFEKIGITHVNLAVLCSADETGRRLMKGDARARDRQEAEKSLGWAWHENLRGGDVYIRPARWMPDGTEGRWPILFLDDLSAAAADDIAHKYLAAVVETSPGLHHVWIAVSRALAERERKALQQRLAAEHGGDPGSVSGEHFGRMPGFKNNKRGGVFVNTRTISAGRPYPVGDLSLPPDAQASREGGARASHEPHSLYSSLGGWSSESEREFGYVIGRLRWLSQRDPSQLDEEAARLTTELITRAAARGKRDPAAYAQRTVRAALARL